MFHVDVVVVAVVVVVVVLVFHSATMVCKGSMDEVGLALWNIGVLFEVLLSQFVWPLRFLICLFHLVSRLVCSGHKPVRQGFHQSTLPRAFYQGGSKFRNITQRRNPKPLFKEKHVTTTIKPL